MNTEPVTSLRPPAWDVVDWTAYWERLSGELRQLEVDKAEAEKELAALLKRHKVLTDENNALSADAEQAGASVFKLSADARAIEAKISLASTELAELRQQKADLVEEIERQATERDTLQSEAECIRAGLSVERVALDARSVELDARQTAMDASSAQQTERGSELDAREAQVEPRVRELLASRTQALEGRERELRTKEMLQQRALYKEWGIIAVAIVGAVAVGLVIAFFAYIVGVESRP